MEQNKNTALLVMDMQVGIVAMLQESSSILEHVERAIIAARKNKIPVIYVIVGFRNGAPEIGDGSSKTFAAGRSHFSTINMDEFMAVHPDLAPAADEVTVVKRRVSAFTGSDLEVLLRAKEIKHLVLTGIATSGVVLSTLREAADKDYQITVLADACADSDPEVHTVLTTKVFTRQANVMKVDEWING